jgi:hypothetical protein
VSDESVLNINLASRRVIHEAISLLLVRSDVVS